MEVTKSLGKEDEVFMPSFLHSHRNHRKSLTVMDDIFHAKISKRKTFGEQASAAWTKFFLRNTACNPEQAR